MDHSQSVSSDLATAAGHIARSVLCRSWLVGPGDLCDRCRMARECPDRNRCLHLAASVGAVTRLDGPWQRIPLGSGALGRVVVDLEPVLLQGDRLLAAGAADPAWLALHGIRTFAAWPIHEDGQPLGALALFTSLELGAREREAIEALCRLAAAALAASHDPVRAAGPDAADSPAARSGSMAEIQRGAILAALARTGGKLSGPGGAAEILAMKPTTLESRIRRLGLRKPPRLKLR